MMTAEDSIYITPFDLRKLTGWARTAKQIDYLRANGIAFRINGCGIPLVTKDEAMMVRQSKQQKQPQKWQSSVLQAA
jgi:hypothetical protein